MNTGNRILKAVEIILNYGGTDGGHHKQWVLDQTLRILMGDEYANTIELYEEPVDDNGDKMYEWDTGIAP